MQALLCLTSLFGPLKVIASANTAALIESPRIPTVHSCNNASQVVKPQCLSQCNLIAYFMKEKIPII